MGYKVLLGLLVMAMFVLSGCNGGYTNYTPANETKNVSETAAETAEKEAAPAEKEEKAAEAAIEEEEVEAEEVAEEEVTEEVEEEAAPEEEITASAGEAQLAVNEGELVKIGVNGKDPDGDEIAFTFSSPLDADGEWQTGYGDAGKYEATITASDGKATVSKKVLIVVNNVNRAPELSDLEEVIVKEGDKVTIEPVAKDPDGDEVTFTYTSPLDANGEWQTGYEDSGKYEATITVSDGKLETSKKVAITVEDVNRAPEFEIVTE